MEKSPLMRSRTPASRASSRRGGLLGGFWTFFTILAVLSCAPAREASSSLQSSGETPPPEAGTAEDQTWDRLLQSALDHTAGDRAYVERVAKDAALSERIRRLAALLLEEWDLDPTHSRLLQPRLVWAPEADLRKIPPESRKRIAPFVIVQGVVGQDGKFQAPHLKASAGSPAADEVALQAARQAAFRPARRTRSYEEQPATFTIRWHF